MINFLKDWTNQIVVSIIIATILEMIIPDGNNKKYIKMIIGIYLLFNIIEPIAIKITGKSIETSSFNYSKYFNNDISQSINSKNFEDNNSKLIEETYVETMKNDIISKITQKGYKVEKCNIEIMNDINKSTYGSISSLNLTISNIESINKDKKNMIIINEINISDNTFSTNNIEEDLISNEDIKILKEYLSKEYSIDIQNININE